MLRPILNTLQDYFGFSRKEARGFVVVFLLMILMWIVPVLYRKLFKVHDHPVVESKKLDSLVSVLQAIKVKEKKERYSPDYNNKYNNSTPNHPLVLTDFDPNTASTEQLQQLGMPQFLAERIEKYRSKGGKFKQKEDLQKIYGLSPSLYHKLEPHIQIAQKQAVDATNSSPEKAIEIERPKFSKPQQSNFDINTADTSQLIKLKGIGSKLAARIVKFRDGLGGFHSQNQFNEIFGLDSLALSELNRFGQIKSSVKKIALNTASAEDLDRLPYLSFKQAQIIVRYREQHGAYQSADELLKIKIFDQKIIDKIAPYLAF